MPSAVLVIDMLRGFLEEGYPLYCGEDSRRIIPNVVKLLEDENRAGDHIFFICDNHAPDDPEFEMFPPHCISGTREAEVIPKLAGFPGKLIPKTRYSAFFDTDLEARLKELSPDKLIVCGVCTDICVLHTVAHARLRGYEVEVHSDCVASFDESAHRFALDHMERVLGARVVRPAPPDIPTPHFETPESILSGQTADIYFLRAREILEREGLDPTATMEVFSRGQGILCGINEALALLSRVLPGTGSEVWALPEGEAFTPGEVVLRLRAPYRAYAVYETAYLGMLASCSGWATAARECVDAARGTPVISFGARHIHPGVCGMMEYAAIVGGCSGGATTAGAELAGTQPIGTIPHALILAMGDTSAATLAFDRHMPPEIPRVALVDTFHDEVEESIMVARAMEGRLQAVRLDTPFERGRVRAELVKETRARLDLAGFESVRIYVSGGLNPDRIRYFIEAGAPVDTFAVGSYVSGATPIDFTADIHEIDGRPVAKRGRIPGITPNPRLKRVL